MNLCGDEKIIPNMLELQSFTTKNNNILNIRSIKDYNNIDRVIIGDYK